MRSLTVPSWVRQLNDASQNTNESRIAFIQQHYKNLLKGQPEVSIVIPAYNEADVILTTLHSLCQCATNRSVEIIVVNNNSKDNTEQLVRASGVICVNEPKQGVTNARNTGLDAAKGKYILNADADSIYPTDWIEALVSPLAANESVSMSYGRYTFIPTGVTSRFTYFFYETIVDILRWLKKTFKEEAVNVGGASSCFRKEQALQVDKFNHPPSANEDGFLALKLRNKGFGKLYPVYSAIVWTTDRRLQIDGGLVKGIIKRIKRTFFS